MSLDDDGHNAADNRARCYEVAISALRLRGVKAGRYEPRLDRPEEIEASPLVSVAGRPPKGLPSPIS